MWLNYIYTDTDLFIADTHLHSPDQWVHFRNLASHTINITITNTTIEETSLYFEGDNIRITIINTTIEEALLNFRGNNISVHIENSFVWSTYISSYNPIVFHNCNFGGKKPDKSDNITASQQTSRRRMHFTFYRTIVEFYSCNFNGITTH